MPLANPEVAGSAPPLRRYHQFHDGFAWGEDYPNSYNNLGKSLFKAKVVKDTGCPNGMMGLGVLGL